MGFQQKYETWTVQAQADLRDTTPGTGALYKGVNMYAGAISAGGNEASGILQYAGDSGDHITLAIYGVSKVVFATAINTLGLELAMTTSGYVGLSTSGDYVIGRNLCTPSSGSVGAAMINFLNPWRRTN